jgi:2-C-methyl-D-erythritol 2,4-cyclodiphosphate synthase
MRVGSGIDMHKLMEGIPLVLGGITIPFPKGLDGHSDGDALLHAICDALLGAAGLGDMGKHFPSSDNSLKNISSAVLLSQTVAMLEGHLWKIINIDATIIAEQPKLGSYFPKMETLVANTTNTPSDSVNIKAKTADGLGALGNSEGIAAYAVALIEKTSS